MPSPGEEINLTFGSSPLVMNYDGVRVSRLAELIRGARPEAVHHSSQDLTRSTEYLCFGLTRRGDSLSESPALEAAYREMLWKHSVNTTSNFILGNLTSTGSSEGSIPEAGRKRLRALSAT
ncbi:MAG: hypothetical protein MZV63_25040 [Marinilabiliales bacterium]|nr:hypothetical protein [Marinilabiliales bacterium]